MRGVWILENAKLGVATLWERRTRSGLTILGVFIGALIVVAVASVLNGFRNSVVEQVEEFGTNNIYIYRYPFVQTGRLESDVRRRKPLELEDAQAIREMCPAVREVEAGLQLDEIEYSAVYLDREVQAPPVRGGSPEGELISNASMQEGRYFTEAENLRRSNVVVLGHDVAEALFPASIATGKHITVDGKRLRVVGVTAKRKEGPFGSTNPEDQLIVIPYNTFHKFYPWERDHFISALAHPGRMQEAIEQISELLRRRRKVRFDQDNNFEIGTADSIIESFDQIIAATVGVMFLLSSVAFMVGGVGVMNMMLVSVKERTREIGLRKALGARRSDIRWQFLTEAALLTGIGGALGIGFAELLLIGVRTLLPDLPVATPLWARGFGLIGSMGVGLVFGMWPAIRAARLDPIEALRYE